jgi:hypothetical protein
MSRATKDSILTVPAARLALAAPREWEEFLKAFAAASAERANQLVNSSLEEMPRAQGRAQQCNLHLATLTNCVKDANE